jgi:ABC-2 type transport system ATP-binding protein
MVTMAALETWHLCKEIKGRLVLNQVSLQLLPGKVCAVLGPSGSGKSTLLKIILGVQPPTAGGGLCLGLDIRTMGPQIRERVGFVSQASRFYDYMTAGRLINFCRGFYSRWDGALAEKVLRRFDLPLTLKVRLCNQEMRSCLSLALALAARPGLLLLDHPTVTFDPARRRLFFSIALEEIISAGGSVLVASSRLDEAAWAADHQVLLLDQGRLIYSGPMPALRLPEREIRVAFKHDPGPGIFQRPGVTRVSCEGSAYLITVTENLEEIWQECADRPHDTLELIDPGLEQVMARYRKGVRKFDTVVPFRQRVT